MLLPSAEHLRYCGRCNTAYQERLDALFKGLVTFRRKGRAQADQLEGQCSIASIWCQSASWNLRGLLRVITLTVISFHLATNYMSFKQSFCQSH